MRISPINNFLSNKYRNFNGTFRLVEDGTYHDYSSETFCNTKTYNYYPSENETQEEINKAVEDKIKSAPKPTEANHFVWGRITQYKVNIKDPSEVNEEIKTKYWSY